MSPAVRSVGPVGRVLAESPTARIIFIKSPIELRTSLKNMQHLDSLIMVSWHIATLTSLPDGVWL